MNGTRNCSVEACTKPHFGKGYCNTHYYRIRRNGTLDLKTREQISAEYRASRPEITCGIEGCPRVSNRNSAGMRVCGMHGSRFDRHGHFGVRRVASPLNPNKVACGVEGCMKVQDGNAAFCKLHDTRFRRHGDPMKVIPASDRAMPKGESNHNWVANASYSALHQRIRANRGSASAHACSNCAKRAAQWAYQHNAQDERYELIEGTLTSYSLNIFDYKPMCVKCHKTFDMERIRNEKNKTDGLRA